MQSRNLGILICIDSIQIYICLTGLFPIDVGTNNQKLLNDPGYLGLKEPRLDGEEYYDLIDEFMAAIKVGWNGRGIWWTMMSLSF